MASKPNRFTRWLISHLRKLNLFPRIFLVFCADLLLATLVMTMFTQIRYTNEIEKTKASELTALAQSAMLALQQEKRALEDSLEPFLRSAEVLSSLERRQRMTAAGRQADIAGTQMLNRTLGEIVSSGRGIRALIYVDATPSAATPTELLGTAYVPDTQALLDSEIYTGAVQAAGYPYWRDSTPDTPTLFYDDASQYLGIPGCLTLSYQLYTPKSRQPLGVLICCVSPQHLVQSVTEYTFHAGTNAFLVGDNGLLEGIGADFSAPPFPAKSSGLLDVITGQKKGSRRILSPSGDILMSFCGDSGFPVHAVNLTYRDYVMQPVYQLRWLSVWIMLAVLAIGALSYYLVAISIVYPTRRLIRTMKQVGSGHFEQMYHPESHDEIGILCSEFDKMVKDMLSLLDRMYESETRQKELELAQKSAQLDALQMQVNPHFLYNTLDMIRWQCMYETGGESPASDMIEKFCVLLRMTIKGDRQKETVSDSLLHAKTYLDVVNFRHTQKIALETDFDFDPGSYCIPCLSIQPILENAVRHGFSGEATDHRCIRITGRLSSEAITICVSDNGIGMTQEQLAQILSQLEAPADSRDNLGLRNVNQRCRLCYGDRYGLTLSSTPGLGTTVTLTIPPEPMFV